MKIKKTMPNKIGKVGRKKLSPADKAIRLDVWKNAGQVALLGGKKEVENQFRDYFDKKILIHKELNNSEL